MNIRAILKYTGAEVGIQKMSDPSDIPSGLQIVEKTFKRKITDNPVQCRGPSGISVKPICLPKC